MSNTQQIQTLKLLFLRKVLADVSIDIGKLADRADLKVSYLYEITSERRKLNNDQFGKIINCLSITFLDDYEIYEQAKSKLFTLFKCLVIKDFKTLDAELVAISHNEHIYTNSYAFVFIPLFDMIRNIADGNLDNNSKGGMEEASNYIKAYDNETALIYLMLICLSYILVENISLFEQVLDFATKKYSFNNVREEILGMYYYQCARLDMQNCKYVRSIQNFMIAQGHFKNIFCLNRVLQCEIEIASLYVRIGQYDEAENQYLHLLNISIENNYIERIRPCFANLAYVYLLKEEYAKTLETVDKAKMYCKYSAYLYYYKAFALYKLGELEDCKDIIYKYRYCKQNNYVSLFLEMLRQMMLNNFTKIDKIYEKISGVNKTEKDYVEQKFIIRTLLIYYKEKDVNRFKQLVFDYLEITKPELEK